MMFLITRMTLWLHDCFLLISSRFQNFLTESFSKISHKFLTELKTVYTKCTAELRKEISQIKLTYNGYMESMNHDYEVTTEVFSRFKVQTLDQDTSSKFHTSEILKLNSRVLELQSQLAINMKNEEVMIHLSPLIEKLKNELLESEKENIKITSNLKERIENVSSLTSINKLLNIENIRLKEEVIQIESNCFRVTEAARRRESVVRNECDEVSIECLYGLIHDSLLGLFLCCIYILKSNVM